jgi:hypothetical protein
MQILVIIKCPEKTVEKYGICVVGSKKFTSASEKNLKNLFIFPQKCSDRATHHLI